MSDRRRFDRVCIANRITGVVSLRQEVAIERLSQTELSVISESAVPRGEELALELAFHDGTSVTSVTRVADRRPALHNGRACHRLSLASARGLGTRWHELRTPAAAVTVRRVEVGLVDISARGCLLRSAHSLGEGAVGLLDLSIDGHLYADAMRVSRATSAAGSGGYRTAGQFLPIAPPSIRSVRWLAEWLGKGCSSRSHRLGCGCGRRDDHQLASAVRRPLRDGIRRGIVPRSSRCSPPSCAGPRRSPRRASRRIQLTCPASVGGTRGGRFGDALRCSPMSRRHGPRSRASPWASARRPSCWAETPRP